ncbi:hypothetical protein PPL_01886 [Heterostelium album PN500]|uniref:Uncharacterized protein n=1 Tax=Heterostelium pallidum (strain ATCC 26659 / Pp 5 / PN500) TaxID=670386 RepID=D3B0R9_HETP5|nr:hypothetical protein PPL_01886 [Heterostelium album PN500]EFA84893.1 hypothetical protein PPL_01886 [Heterostelium album PN500]|eukprot:XP_020437004.1 hypothetical protein PPL_01886 [Heterostelium album PN500]
MSSISHTNRYSSILLHIILYTICTNEDEKNELVEIMKEYSLKHSGLKKDMLIDAIIKHQQHLTDLKSKLVTDNSIEKFHRGTVEYRLPTLIIYRIIRDLWHDDITFNLNTNQLRSNYRWLLSISRVSKELFKLISSLFSRVNLFDESDLYIAARDPTAVIYSYTATAQKLKNKIINPLSRISVI